MNFINCTYVHILFVIIFLFISNSSASNGDRTQFFRNCRQNCERQNCSADGIELQEQAIKYYKQSVFDKALQWTCADECQYGCMWRTVDAFLDRGWNVPQFYGKWPFMRFLGFQEPASVFFSILNLVVHYRMFQKFRREVRPDSPCYRLWQVFSLVSLNGWVWSIVFHARDFPFTELMDYAFAYSIVLATFACMVLRMLHKNSLFLRGLLTLTFLSFYVNYFAYLSVNKFSYALNMKINILTGILSAGGWLSWCFIVRKKYTHNKKILNFYVLLALSMTLEVFDFPPILWIFDAHALWHLVTAPIIVLFYSFIIDDCKILRKEKTNM
ncbi:post-GPI attachment to proteins factor 3 [Teleopsis dalmanni]|uniref:post-GPI attachment to proteins factor 3 n=1 Tax=Teleopsis dalmanni TaxID=139649 RepID=UPI0018CDD395|nr:post-GPI attachment to proteins factor 3 [Teleopsis dalmanni]